MFIGKEKPESIRSDKGYLTVIVKISFSVCSYLRDKKMKKNTFNAIKYHSGDVSY
jgi:uncharacterized membrane protein YiaA